MLKKKDCNVKELERLRIKIEGVKNMKNSWCNFHSCVKEENCPKRRYQSGVKLIASADTNDDPTKIDYPVPGNDVCIHRCRIYLLKREY
jgi:ribosomal protein S2